MLGVERRLELLEQTKGRLEVEVRQLTVERTDMLDQLNTALRQKNASLEDVVKLRRDVERSADIAVQLNSDKEVLAKDNAELAVRAAAVEQENRQLVEVTFLLLFGDILL